MYRLTGLINSLTGFNLLIWFSNKIRLTLFKLEKTSIESAWLYFLVHYQLIKNKLIIL